MNAFRPGQLWTSGAEPELGLGLVVAVDARSVEVAFDAADCRRRYACSTAPLVRVAFAPGDAILARDGSSLVVRRVEEVAGLLVYSDGDRRLAESEVAPRQGAPGPLDRLRRGESDPTALFDLRQEAFAHRHRLARSPVRGLVGARIRLLPHQLFIAAEVAERDAPRVLLADEVGLGKTIEAGLVASRLIATGRVERVLVATPEHLVHQWFVELLRRFNLRFRIFDEERCAAAESASGGNPFQDEQLVLCGLPLLAGSGGRGAQAVAAGWDLLVVDEVHHLSWAPGKPSPGYAAVAALARSAAGVLLLSGTPSRRGEQSHFARLHLLDPVRHPDWESHLAEASREEEAARLVARAAAAESVPDDGSLVLDGGDREAEAIALDRFGPGRALFRNTRASVGGFPRRVARPAPLDATGIDPQVLDAIAREVASDPSARGAQDAASRVDGAIAVVPGDPRVRWLAGLIRRIAPAKILVIARTADQVLSLADALEREISVKRAVFHEGMTLVQRDRQAAWFAEPDGARVLLSSEIGGEGRNFQFAHHLVLFDLPLDPEQLEQRIGRLDRIGQEHDVEIHVPFVVGSAHEVLQRWYAEGLGAFERPAPDGNCFLEVFGSRLAELAIARHRVVADARGAHEEAVERLVQETHAMRDEVAARHAAGRDRLLERASFRRAEAASIVGAIAARDADPVLREFLERAFDHASVEVEDL
ncbi:RNA polymerase-associated protein RapA, partial [bacterium]|nr:RNA polymerase-associated protein RapA [bacterium]